MADDKEDRVVHVDCDIAEHVIEMADRAKVAHAISPGATAESFFTMDETRFHIAVSVAAPVLVKKATP